MVVTPHAGLALGYFRIRRNVVPSVGTMVNAVQQQAFMLRVDCEIGFLQKLVGNGEARLRVDLAGCTQ